VTARELLYAVLHGLIKTWISNQHLKLEAIVNALTFVNRLLFATLVAPVFGLPLAILAPLDVVMIGMAELGEPFHGPLSLLDRCVLVSDVLKWMN
jgi:hypothetical protein